MGEVGLSPSALGSRLLAPTSRYGSTKGPACDAPSESLEAVARGSLVAVTDGVMEGLVVVSWLPAELISKLLPAVRRLLLDKVVSASFASFNKSKAHMMRVFLARE